LCLRGRDREGEREKRQDERKGRRKNINQLTKNISTSIEIGGRRIEVGIFYGVRAWVGTKELIRYGIIEENDTKWELMYA